MKFTVLIVLIIVLVAMFLDFVYKSKYVAAFATKDMDRCIIYHPYVAGPHSNYVVEDSLKFGRLQKYIHQWLKYYGFPSKIVNQCY